MQRLGYTADGYLRQLEYRDTVKLLQEKLVLFLRLNEKLRNNIADKHRFVNNTAEAIEFNLMQFSEAYREKFILPDMEGYCLRFIELINPVLIGFVKEIGFDAQGFSLRFRLW
ncbi:hypothetical protein [Pedobacter hiemivivus]|uniref:Uncharacterized protein n=1 Tax=Pedobacter hiemivivus TaxID=2530454 RepID=A0A4R0NA79_9SPHI|nr:hypothetical protein [Pedobacter hiemivivus]TCC96497.1 hypothetical protein EZ444_10970 [Pedobacter hiemivivus]